MAADHIRDYEWGMLFMPYVCQIIGPRILTQATVRQDIFEATDLIVIEVGGLHIAVRIRRMQYQQYAHQFTIRYSRPSGIDTEWYKVTRKGWGDLFFYAIALNNTVVDSFFSWMLIDLHLFRGHLIDPASRKAIRFVDKWNTDGTSFRAFDADSFPKPSIFIDRAEPRLITPEPTRQIIKPKTAPLDRQLCLDLGDWQQVGDAAREVIARVHRNQPPKK